MEMKEGGRPCSGAVELSAGRHSHVVENAKTVRRSVVTAPWNGSV
jgi:hypothetical protein